MPYKPYWLQRLPEIIERLRTLSVQAIDRPTFESIFQLRRRRAIELMHILGSHRGRRGFVLDRCALVGKLESFETVTQYHWEQQARYSRVVEQLPRVAANTINGSNGIDPGRRHVVIEFTDEGELIQKLLVVLHAAFDGEDEQARTSEKRSPSVLQYGHFEQAIQAFQKQCFCEAEALFAQACAGPDERIRTSAETYLRMCKRRTEKVFSRTR